MPRFVGTCLDVEIAGIISFLRTELGANNAGEIDPGTVNDVRESLQESDEDAEDTGEQVGDNDE